MAKIKTKIMTTEIGPGKSISFTNEEHAVRVNKFTEGLAPGDLTKISTTPLLGDNNYYVIVTTITYLEHEK